MPTTNLLAEVAEAAPNRRKFMQTLSMATAGAAALLATPKAANAQGGITDVDILNFALNLEYLEAEFYTVATSGQTIDQLGIGIDGAGQPGPTYGGQQVDFSDTSSFTNTVAKQVAADERSHVRLIRSALQSAGIQPVSKPTINLTGLGFGFGSSQDFVELARALEDIGVSAYAGAAPLIQDRNILGVAARILATEAEHVGVIRLLATTFNIPTTTLDGKDIVPPPSGNRLFSVDDNGLVQVRTPGQVLFLAYGLTAAATNGGFFPNGVNGNIYVSDNGA